MFVEIKETGEEKELECICQGQDVAQEIFCNWGMYDNVLTAEEYGWWLDIMARIEALDETGIDFSDYDLVETDLEMRIEQMEGIARSF